jgi:hypothetical protein
LGEGLKYPINKLIQKQLPLKKRVEHWVDYLTGERFNSVQYVKLPLNPDCLLFPSKQDQLDLKQCTFSIDTQSLVEDLNQGIEEFLSSK